MKKILALVLALVMTLGLATVGANAATYSDADDINYKEAVDVMTALKVFDGIDGAFKPTGTLTREQGAKIIAYMILGKTAADALSTTGTKFVDVAADRWSAGSIAYCTSEGIIAGVGEGKFNPTGNLTGYAFAKMLLCALGYDAETEGLIGETFTINTAKLAQQAGLLGDLDDLSMSAGITREQACQMALNTEQATMVEYESKLNVTGTDLNVSLAAKRNEVVRNNGAVANYAGGWENGAGTGAGTLQFCEKYASKLFKVAGTTDTFSRPVDHVWRLNGLNIVSELETPVVTYTSKPKASKIVSDLASYWIAYTGDAAGTHNDVNDVAVAKTVSGVTVVSTAYDGTVTAPAINPTATVGLASKIRALTDNGKTVEIYADESTNQITKIIVIGYAVDKVASTTSNTTRATYTIANQTYRDYVDSDADDTIVIPDGVTLAKDQVITYTTGADGKLYVYPTTKVEGAQTKFATINSDTTQKAITVDGTDYTIGSGVQNVVTNGFKTNGKGVFYLDQFGYVVMRTNVGASSDYAYIVGVGGTVTSALDGNTATVQVRAVLADGTVGVYDLAMAKYGSTGGPTGASSAKSVGAGAAFATGDYAVKNTDFMAYDSSTGPANTTIALGAAATTYFKNTVWGYTLDGTTMTLEAVTALPTNNALASADTTYGATLGSLTHNKTAYTKNGATIYVDGTSAFVIYNTSTKSAAVYTGANSLPTSVDGTTGYAILKTSTASKSNGTANVIFATNDNITSDALSSYVYIDADEYSTVSEYGSKKNVKLYTGVTNTEDELPLYDPSGIVAKNGTGLYSYNSNNEVSAVLANSGNITPNKTYYLFDNSVDLSNNSTLLGVGPDGNVTYYYYTADTKLVYIDNTVDGINGNSAFVVLDGNNGSRNGNVAAIYMVGSSSTLAGGAVADTTVEAALLTSDSVVINDDVTLSGNLVIPAGKVVSVTGNLTFSTASADVRGALYVGGTLTTDGGETITGTNAGSIVANSVSDGGALTINYVTLDVANNLSATTSVAVDEGANVTVGGTLSTGAVTVGGTAASTLEVDTLTATGDLVLDNDSTLTLNDDSSCDDLQLGCTLNVATGKTLTVAGTDNDLDVNDNSVINGNVTMTAGHLDLDADLIIRNGTVTIAEDGSDVANGCTLTIENGAAMSTYDLTLTGSGAMVVDGTLTVAAADTLTIGTGDITGSGMVSVGIIADMNDLLVVKVPSVTLTGTNSLAASSTVLDETVTSFTITGATTLTSGSTMDFNNAALTISGTGGGLDVGTTAVTLRKDALVSSTKDEAGLDLAATTLTLDGCTLSITGDAEIDAATITGTGSLSVGSAVDLKNNAIGTLTISGTATIGGATTVAKINNADMKVVVNADSTITDVTAVGEITVGAATLTFTNGSGTNMTEAKIAKVSGNTVGTSKIQFSTQTTGLTGTSNIYDSVGSSGAAASASTATGTSAITWKNVYKTTSGTTPAWSKS